MQIRGTEKELILGSTPETTISQWCRQQASQVSNRLLVMNSLVVLWTTIVSMGVFRPVESALDQVVPQSKSTWPPASLTFVMDTTGSMHDDLAQVKEAVNVIFDSIIANPDVPVQNFVLVPFHDPGERRDYGERIFGIRFCGFLYHGEGLPVNV